MRVGYVFLGAGVAVFAVLEYRFAMHMSRSEHRLRRMAESRWRIDRHFSRRVRRGELTKEEWIEEAIPQLSEMWKSWQRPMMVLWICIGVYVAIAGFLGS